MNRFIVVDDPATWQPGIKNIRVLSVSDYLTNTEMRRGRGSRVFNLAASYRYQSRGYYVSLLAEARGHKVIPSVTTIQELNATGLIRFFPAELNEIVQKSLRPLHSDQFTLTVYFGENIVKTYQALASALYQMFRAPLLRFSFRRGKEEWILRGVRALALEDVPPTHVDFLHDVMQRYFSRKRFPAKAEEAGGYDLAILVNPDEKAPPSDKKALDSFVKAARKERFSVEFITRADYSRIAEYDALFIRETTSVNHHTWRMARRAEADGLVVIDDPQSILRCANKVFLAELLGNANISTPRTLMVQKHNKDEVTAALGLPCVLKLPDSSFSVGVEKAISADDFDKKITAMLDVSELVIAQEYIPTDFDWRIGILDGEPLFACKYFMARGHWQIYNWKSTRSRDTTGDWQTMPVEEAPAAMVATAVKACKLIGNGLYGVDLKEIDGKPVVIEINDNPNIDSGVEDQALGKALYQRIMQSLRRRVENRNETTDETRP